MRKMLIGLFAALTMAGCVAPVIYSVQRSEENRFLLLLRGTEESAVEQKAGEVANGICDSMKLRYSIIDRSQSREADSIILTIRFACIK
jgi:hypothetical protein